jgi:succinate dehydrogenase hydrophobic anchor subunit
VHCAGDNVSYGYGTHIPSLGNVLHLGFLLIWPKLRNVFEDDRINWNDERFEVFTDVAFLETSVHTISTQRHIQEDGILQN